MAKAELEPLSRNRAFRIFWIGQSLSMLCEAIASVAMPLLVLQATGSVAHLGGVTAVGFAGQLLALTLGGGMIDRHRLRLMIVCDLVRAALFGLLVVAVATGLPLVPIIYLVAAVASLFSNLFDVACQTVVKDMIRPSDFVAANARIHGSYGLAFAVGPALGGLILQRLGPAVAVSSLVAAFLVSAGSLVLIRGARSAETAPSPSPSPSGEGQGVRALGHGVRYILGDRILRATIPFGALAVALTASTVNLLIFYLKDILGASESSIGLVLGASCAGVVLAAFVTPAIRRRWGLAVTALTALCIQGVCMAAIVGAAGLGICIIGGIAFCFGDRLRMIVLSSAEQERVESSSLGRVVAAKTLLLGIVAPLAVSACTAAAARWGVQPVLFGSGVAAIVVGVAGLIYRSLKPALLDVGEGVTRTEY
ncbi:MAG: transporter [Myxococcales bacterium]|nr:transporter [Myxococcales bacterium]